MPQTLHQVVKGIKTAKEKLEAKVAKLEGMPGHGGNPINMKKFEKALDAIDTEIYRVDVEAKRQRVEKQKMAGAMYRALCKDLQIPNMVIVDNQNWMEFPAGAEMAK